MTKKYAILKNVNRGINFGVVIKSDGINKYYGWSEKGIQWSEWANKNQSDLSNLPSGISVGEFKNLSDEMMKKIVVNSSDVVTAGNQLSEKQNRSILTKSIKFANVSKYPKVTGMGIPVSAKKKKITVSYKVKHFKQSTVRSEIAFKVRINELAFNYETKQFNAKPNRASQMAERHSIQQKISRGPERQFGERITQKINQDIISHKNAQLIYREEVGANTKEIVDFFVKGRLGYAIGRGIGASTSNRGSRGRSPMRGMASRVISGMQDPRNRRDVDGDGMIFDGTWREMPDPTRTKPSERIYRFDEDKAREEYNRSIRRGSGLGSTSGKPKQPKFQRYPGERDKTRRVIDPDVAQKVYDYFKEGKGTPKTTYRNTAKKFNLTPYEVEAHINFIGSGRSEPFVIKPEETGIPYEEANQKLGSQVEANRRRSLSSSTDDVRDFPGKIGTNPDIGEPARRRREAGEAFGKLLGDINAGEDVKKIIARTSFVDEKKKRGLSSRTSQSIEDAIGFMDSVDAGGADWDSGLRKAWESDGKNWGDWGDLVSSVTAKLSGLSQDGDFQKADEKEKLKKIKDVVNSTAKDLSKEKGHRYNTSSLDAFGKYVGDINAGRDADASRVIASFDPDGPKSSRANALEASVAYGLDKLGETISDRKKYLNSRGRSARFGSLIDDLLASADGANEPSLEKSLKKIKSGISLSKDDSSDLLETLKDISNNNDEFKGDERLADLIKDVGGMRSSSNKDKYNNLVEEILEASRGANEKDLVDNLNKFISGGALSDDERSSLAESLQDVLDNNDLFEDDGRLEKLLRDVQEFPEIDEGRPSQYRDAIKAIKKYGRKNPKERGLRSSSDEDNNLGSDTDDAIAAITKIKQGKELTSKEINSIVNMLDNLDMTRLDEDSRIALMDLRKEATKQKLKVGTDILKSLRGFRSSTDNDDLGDDLSDAVAAITKRNKGQKLSRNEMMQVAEVIDNLDLSRLDEDSRINFLDFRAEVAKELRDLSRSSGLPSSSSMSTRRRPINQSIASRMTTATTERASRPRGLASETAVAEKATDVKEPIRKKRRVTDFSQIFKNFGVKKNEGDGVLWESMSDDDRAKAKDAILAHKIRIEKELKTKRFKNWWRKATEEGLDKQSLRAVKQRARGKGGKLSIRPEDDSLTKADALELMRILDEEVSKGRIDKYDKGPDGAIKVDKNGRPVVTKAYGQAQRMLDDLVTILNMEENEDYSLLEHLHSATRKMVHAKVGSVNTGRFAGPGKDSSIAGQAGGIERAASIDELSDAEVGKAKKLALGKRLLRVNEKRAAKARQKAMRRTGGFRRGRILTEGDPALEIKKAKLRSRAMKRTLLSKFRGTRDADALAADLGKVKAETSPVNVDNAGKVTITGRYVDILAKLDNDISKTGTDEEKQKVYDQSLADLWENIGYSDTPTLVTEDEARRLVSAGWQPVIRGTGGEAVNSESYVEQFLTNAEARFIPGQGARAFGVGEYFAFPGSNWTGYRGGPNDRHSIVVLIPPSADIVSTEEITRERDKMRDLTTRAVEATKSLGGKKIAEAMTPGELAAAYRKEIPNLDKETSRSGQIVNQLIQRLETLEGMPPSDAATLERKRILGAFDYLSRFTKLKDVGYFAPIIGVDGIDTNSGSDVKSPFLLHNRTGVAAFLKPITSDEAESMSAGSDGKPTGNIWRSWATRTDRSREGAAVGDRKRVLIGGRKRRVSTRRPDPDDDTTSPSPQSQSEVPTSRSAINADAWTKSTPANTGSNPAILLTDPNGTSYYTKLKKPSENIAQAQERMETEVLAGKLYELAGIPSADLQMGTRNGDPVMLSRMVQTRMPNSSDNAEVRKGFVADAWLANWDAPLNDNIKIDNNGRAVRLDVGGSLDYRAQGAKKGSDGTTGFGNSVGEMTSLQKSGGNIDFKNMDANELKKQAQKLGTITDDDVRKTVAAIVSDPARAKILADTLIARRDDIIKRYG